MNIGSSNYVYRCTVIRWIDGDTVELDVDLGFKVTLREKMRLAGVNCPELNSSMPEVRALAFRAKEVSEALAPPGSVVNVQSHKGGIDKYGRWLASIFLSDGKLLSDTLFAFGLAVKA